MNTTIKIALTNLGKYNEGTLVYEWIELPATSDELNEVYETIGINEEYEETFITDYEAPFPINEHANIDELNDIAAAINELDDYQALAFRAHIEQYGVMYLEYINDALNFAIDGDYQIHEDMDDMQTIAEHLVLDVGLFDYDENNPLMQYIDYERLGRELDIEGTFVFIDGDCVEIME